MRIIGALIILFCGTPLRSQTVQVSVIAGIGASEWKSRQIKIAQSSIATAYGVGFKYSYPQQQHISIHADILAQRFNFTRKVFVAGNNGFTGQMLGTERFDYISIPVYAGWSFFKRSFKLFVKAGAYFNLIYDHELRFRNFTSQGSTFEIIKLYDHSSEDLGCIFSAGFQSPLGRRMTY